MEATVQLPDALARRLERLAQQEGTNLPGLIQRLLTEHLEEHQVSPPGNRETRFPLIPRHQTGVVRPVTGADLDEMFAREDPRFLM
jgi:hypothetical protein